jgi:hypothetical protein
MMQRIAGTRAGRSFSSLLPCISTVLAWAAPVLLVQLAACGSSKSPEAPDSGGSTPGDDATPGNPVGDDGATAGGDDAGTIGTVVDGAAGTDASPPADAGSYGPYPAGWLFTRGNKIYLSNGSVAAPTVWMGRGVNMDDIFYCGYDNTLWMAAPGMTPPDVTLETEIAGVMSAWKPNFVRMSLAMDSYGTAVSWVTDPAQYAVPMTNVIDALGAYPGVHVLVTLRTDASMIEQASSDKEPTGVPSDSTNTPDKVKYPTGTDATYVGLVDSFAHDGFVLFGLTNEPGGNDGTAKEISGAMSHAVGVIRAEEDRLHVPHHLVSVQGIAYTSNIGFYSAAVSDSGAPDAGSSLIPYDNVVYEVHGYPPAPSSYTFSNIPVIIGEYGSLSNASAFYADVETKEIPNLAWDFDSFNNCAPDLVNVTQSATDLEPSTWGMTVQPYLLAHAQ